MSGKKKKETLALEVGFFHLFFLF